MGAVTGSGQARRLDKVVLEGLSQEEAPQTVRPEACQTSSSRSWARASQAQGTACAKPRGASDSL